MAMVSIEAISSCSNRVVITLQSWIFPSHGAISDALHDAFRQQRDGCLSDALECVLGHMLASPAEQRPLVEQRFADIDRGGLREI